MKSQLGLVFVAALLAACGDGGPGGSAPRLASSSIAMGAPSAESAGAEPIPQHVAPPASARPGGRHAPPGPTTL